MEENLIFTDYLGNVEVIYDYVNAAVVKQNSFDAWGRNRDPQNWNNVLPPVTTSDGWDRGYTGHEHIPEFGIINRNGRLYDPVIGRMLSPDPYIMGTDNTQGYNRYTYALNNPLKYTDPSGEVAWFVPLIYAAVNVGVDLAINKGKMNFGQIAMSAGTGALGGLTSGATSVGGALVSAAFSQVNRVMPNISIYQSNGFSLGVSPMVGFGTSGFNFGASLNASGQVGDFSYSASVGIGYNSGVSSLGDAVGGSGYWNAGGFLGYTHNSTLYGGGFSYNKFFGGKTNQGIGAIHLQIGDFGLRFDEDFIGDGYDRYRTGGLLMSYRINSDVTLALGGSMMTGMANRDKRLGYGNPNPYGDGSIAGTYDNCGEDLYNLRGGTMYGGIIYKGQSYFYGHNSGKRLHTIQNWIHRNITKTSPYFEDRMFRSRSYSYYGGYHPFYLNY